MYAKNTTLILKLLSNNTVDMSEEYDGIIIGAGPAGAQAARSLASRDYDVAVLETESRDEFPRTSNKSTAGTFPRMMSAFDIPDDVVMQYTDSVVLESPENYFVDDKAGAVLDFGDFKNFLVDEGEENGADYFFDARAFGPVMGEDSVEGVKYNGDQEIYGDIIIDASGPSAVIAGHDDVGIVDLEGQKRAVGIEYEIDGAELDPANFDSEREFADLSEAMMFRMDHGIAPGGYAWIFDTGDNTAKVGVCYIQNTQHSREAIDGKTIDDYLQEWIVDDPRFEAESVGDINPLEKHRGSAHVQMPDNFSSDNVMAIGDTVPSVDPLWGEGIHTGMESARAAAITADDQLTGRKIGKEINPDDIDLSAYDTRWNRDVGPNRTERYFLTQAMYNLDNDRFDTLMDDLRDADLDALSELNNGNLSKIFEIARPGDAEALLRATHDTARQKNEAIRKAEDWVRERVDNIK